MARTRFRSIEYATTSGLWRQCPKAVCVPANDDLGSLRSVEGRCGAACCGCFRECGLLRKLFETVVARCMKERPVDGEAFGSTRAGSWPTRIAGGRWDRASSCDTSEGCKNFAKSRALARSEDLAVSGENLLDECGAEARHADGDDRCQVAVCCPRTLVQAGGAERLIGVNKSAVPIARKWPEPREQFMGRSPMRERAARRASSEPNFGEVEARHGRVLWNRLPAHFCERSLRSL